MFFSKLADHQTQLAVIDQELTLTYTQLSGKVDEFSAILQEQLRHPECQRPLVFLHAKNNYLTLVAYLSCLRLGFPLLLLDPDLSADKRQNLEQVYQPNLLIDDLNIKLLHYDALLLSEVLALMLSTSGSTGSPKQVCLSAKNLQANAESICEFLPIQPSDKTITSLPFFYSYGLSVINSHLLAGACIVFNQATLLSREFWDCFKLNNINSLAGVPYSYEMLLRLRFETMDLPSLRYFTQAGGRLASNLVIRLAQLAKATNKRFFIMYGQTEATARMAYLPDEKALDKPNSIGCAIPKGELRLVDEFGHNIAAPHVAGELVYQGDNIMLGYAECLLQLSTFNPEKTLMTGDIACFDEDGDFFIKGRKKRFIKLFGQRVSLDEVERYLTEKTLECYCTGDDTSLVVAVKNHHDIKVLTTDLSVYLKLHPSVIKVISVAQLPVTSNGKKDYQQVLKWAKS